MGRSWVTHTTRARLPWLLGAVAIISCTDSGSSTSDPATEPPPAAEPAAPATAAPAAATPSATSSSNPPATKPGAGNWDARIHSPGVFAYWKLETEETTGLTKRKSYHPFGIMPRADNTFDIALDPTSPPPGSTASMHMWFDTHSGPNPGAWFGNFDTWTDADVAKNDYPSTNTFGQPGQQFWVQFLYKVNDAALGEDILQTTGERIGHKVADIVGGDRSFFVPFYTSEAGKVVLSTLTTRTPEWPLLYTYWPWDGYTDNFYGWKLDKAAGTETYDLQPREKEPDIGISYLEYSKNGGDPNWVPANGRGRIFAGKWMAFQIHFEIVAKDTSAPQDPNGDLHRTVHVQVWRAVLGDKQWELAIEQTRSLLLPYKDAASARDGWGQLVLFPYLTNKDPAQDHKKLEYWYAQAIASRQEIPLPTVDGP